MSVQHCNLLCWSERAEWHGSSLAFCSHATQNTCFRDTFITSWHDWSAEAKL